MRVVRFYKSCPSFFPSSFLLLARPQPKRLHHSELRLVFTAGPLPQACTPVFGAGPPPRAANPIVRCRTSTASMHAQCSAPDLHREQRIPLFAAGPLPQACTPSVRRRTSTASSESHCSLPDLYRKHARPVFGAGPQPRASNPSVRCRTSTTLCDVFEICLNIYKNQLEACEKSMSHVYQ